MYHILYGLVCRKHFIKYAMYTALLKRLKSDLAIK